MLRRVVTRAGRNRIYLNGSLSPLSVLSNVGAGLIHIYGQHEQHTLLRTESHLGLLDAHGGLEEKAAAMKQRFGEFAAAWKRVCDLKEKLADKAREEALLRAQVDEIADAKLDAEEEETLLHRREIFAHAEKLYQTCKEGELILYEGDNAVAGELGRYIPRLREMAEIDPALAEAVALLEGSAAQLDEATALIRQYSDRLHFDPGELERIEDRLAEIHRLKRKYRMSVEDILALAVTAGEQLASLEAGEEELAVLTRRFETARDAAWKTAEELSRARRRAARTLKTRLEREVRDIGLPHTTFEVRFHDRDPARDDPPFAMGGARIGADGIDDPEFYFSPNPGESVRPLARIASGGELSRLMLAIKSLVLTRSGIPDPAVRRGRRRHRRQGGRDGREEAGGRGRGPPGAVRHALGPHRGAGGLPLRGGEAGAERQDLHHSAKARPSGACPGAGAHARRRRRSRRRRNATPPRC